MSTFGELMRGDGRLGRPARAKSRKMKKASEFTAAS